MNRLHVRSPPLLSCFFPRLLIMSKASSPVKCLPPWAHELGLLFVLIWRELFGLLMDWLRSRSVKPSSKKATNDMKKVVPRVEDLAAETNILDLPELALECILGKLSPEGLLEMACVCRCTRERCRSDHVWERHMRKKWGRLMGGAARRQWELYAASRKEALEGSVVPVEPSRPRGLMGSLSCVWPPSWFRSNFAADSSPNNTSLVNSTMHWYLALESGRFWFPAQVFNRENGHLGFMLSCYDAELSYDRHSDTFYARYPPHGCRLVNVEEGVLWDRIRVPSVATPYDLHVSDCLSELSPGDHIEIQWRRNKQFPYGWWYGVIGHLESCDENGHNCLCHKSDTIILEFKQYAPGTRWRQAVVNRKNHLEEGNEMNGFYGGIRKLNCKDEVSMWRQHWPTETL